MLSTHANYYSDLAQILLFPKLKEPLKGIRFESLEEVKKVQSRFDQNFL